MNFEYIRLPDVMRVTLPLEPEPDVPTPILDPDYIDSPVVPQTPFDHLDHTTGEDISREFAEKRQAADEGVCRDALVFLESGLSPTHVIELISIRRCAEFGVTKQKIEAAVTEATKLLAKQKEKSNVS
jgi:hypothetical protein